MKKYIAFFLMFLYFPLFFILSHEELEFEFLDTDELSELNEVEESLNEELIIDEYIEEIIEVQITEIENETTTEYVSNETASEYKNGTVFIINSFNFNITGITRKYALINKGELEEGEEITGFANLVKYVQEKQQILYNQRPLESVNIEYSVGEKREDGKYPVDLEITTKDTWNIIAVPKPQLSSNSGFKLTVNYRDYNFIGTLMPLRFDVGYKYDQYKRNYFTFMLDLDIPFSFLKYNWNFIFYNGIDTSPQLDKPFSYKNTTGFQVQLPFKKTVFIIGFKESFFINQEHDEAYKPLYGDNQDGLYFSSNPFVHWVIPTGIEMKDLGQVYYTPYFTANINHELPPWPLDDIKNEKTLSAGHSLSFGRIDWNNDLRNGISVNISNSYNYSFRNKRYDVRPLDINYQVSVTGHHVFIENFFGISTRFLLRHWFFNAIHETAGDVLRGILDKDVHANFMVSFNFDFPVKVLEARPDEWFGVSFFRLFNFDLYLSPIMDMAIFHHPDHQTVLSFRNFLFTTGLEAIFFPLRMRSIQLRMSFGWNLSRGELSDNLLPGGGYNPSTADKFEYYIGIDLHF